MRHRAEAQYRNYGYDHVVHLRNECPHDAACVVTTNVNPEPIRVPLAVGQSEDVLTFRGSPSRIFTAAVTCRSSTE